jgi:exonuclease SbcD
MENKTYPSGVIRYSGSALHVSCDEQYPHTVSVVEIDKHGGNVTLHQLRINELRHFYTLPLDGSSYHTEKEALNDVKAFCENRGKGYIRLQVDYNTYLSANFTQQVYDLISNYGDEVRYNAKVVWTGLPNKDEEVENKPIFEVAELQQMTDPIAFIERTINQYPGIEIEDLRTAFEEVRYEIQRYNEEKEIQLKKKKS